MNAPLDLINCFDDDDFASLYRQHPEIVRIALADSPELLASLEARYEDQPDPTALEPTGLVAPLAVDPALPELVLLHGITDSHLADNAGQKRDRIWLDLFELVKGKYTGHLTLLEDGETDAPGAAMVTDGYLEKKYQGALDCWAGEGFRSHVYQYDWRKGVAATAAGLGSFLERLETVRSGRKVVLVCHSMGGLVASAFAAEEPEWHLKIQHCVFVGSPLGGSYSPVVSILGMADSIKKLALISFRESKEDFQRMVASFPGLIDMLPNPALFGDAADLYTRDGWPGRIFPGQRWLDQSHALKTRLWNSPIFGSATHLIAQGRQTIAAFPWDEKHKKREEVISYEGDGAVMNLASLAPGLTAFKVDGDHGMLLAGRDVQDAVMRIARDETPQLASIEAADLTGEPESLAEASAAPDGLIGELEEPRGGGEIEDYAGVLAPHFMSTDTVIANSLSIAETAVADFDREALRFGSFSWQNALSLAVASDVAYRVDGDSVVELATEKWGFDGCDTFDRKETQGFVCWDGESVVLSYRGTEKNLGDWIGNLKIKGKNSGHYGKVHTGFYQAFHDAAADVRTLLSHAGATSKRLYLTGHSLGGALAVVAAAEFLGIYPVEGIYTYGQPKLARKKMAAYFAEHYKGRLHRFVNDEDIVPRIPPFFRHIGKLSWFDESGALHATPEGMVYAEAGTESHPELSPEAFEVLQRQARDLYQLQPEGLALPPTDLQAEGLLGVSVSDHSIARAYIPVLRKHRDGVL